MELLLRVRTPDGQALDSRVEIDPDRPIRDLATALGTECGAPMGHVPRVFLARQGMVLDADRPVGECGLVSGDEVLLDPTAVPPRPEPIPIRAVSVDVLAGPDSGLSVVLNRGRFDLGRDPSCQIRIGDPTVSRRHLLIDVAQDWSVAIAQLPEVENAAVVNAVPIEGPTLIQPDDVIQLGSTAIALRPFIRSAEEVRDQLGQIEFHRTPYRPPTIAERPFKAFGPIPTRPEPRRFQMLTAIAPLVGGVAMYAFTQSVQFLALTLLSPVAVVANWFEDRRSGRGRFEQQVEEFHERVRRRKAELDAALAAERVDRVRAAPDLADLVRRAELRTIDLWPRGREAPDFLSLRLGSGDTASNVECPVDNNGDEELIAEAEQAFAGHDVIRDVPVTIDLLGVGVIGIHGDAVEVDRLASSMVLQAACLHGPEDLVIVGCVSEARGLCDWMKWLPHTRSTTSPIGGRHVIDDAESVKTLLSELVEISELRVAETDRRVDRRWPWILVVLDEQLEPEPALLSQLLDRCPTSGISVIWVGASESRVPRQAGAIVDCQPSDAEPWSAAMAQTMAVPSGSSAQTSTLWFTDTSRPLQHLELGQVHSIVADRAARALAPIRDASVATATTSIPRSAPLLGVLGVDHPNAAWLVDRWQTERPYGLEHPVGLATSGTFTLDLVANGPHALIGGTSGAGKSELLQSIVASLLTCYPPRLLNFLFVDYKGGASSEIFRDLPHTAGNVSNLNADLAMRALTSLRAELNRRMRVLSGKAKDLEEMLAKFPDEAPPSLVIVVDEFATLVKEIPDFVAGMVDIAQRGRSLGIHLILATQRPTGSVNDNILANTNLRLSLRMLDAGESNAIIGSRDAADIPVPLRGRGFARLGPRELVAFQSAYSGAPLLTEAGASPVIVTPFAVRPVAPSARRSAPGPSGAPGRTQLDAVIDAVVAAAEQLSLPKPRAPWLEVLPDLIALTAVRSGDPRAEVTRRQPGRLVNVGMVDDPEHQDQYPAIVDLEEGGGLLVHGSGGSGKTTLLRTIALSAALDGPPSDVVIYALDFASRSLRSIESLPHVAAVATGDDLESVTRVIALLESELVRRRALLGAAQAETLTAYLAAGHRLPRLLFLIDGYPNLAGTFQGGGYMSSLDVWLDAVHRITVDGRQVGIHTVMTADRRSIPGVVQSAVSNRLVLRLSDTASYADHGISASRAQSLDLAPGAGLWQGTQLMQVACVSREPDGASQAAAIAAAVSSVVPGRIPDDLTTSPMPDLIPLASIERSGRPNTCALGVSDLTGAPVEVDVTWTHVLVAGPGRSGRSNLLALAAEQFSAERSVWSVGAGNSPLAEIPSGQSAFGRPEGLVPLLERLAAHLDDFADPTKPELLLVDDLDLLDDPATNTVCDRLARHEALRVIATVESRNLSGFTMNGLLNEVRRARQVVHLQPDDAAELFQATGVKVPIRPGLAMVPGRGVLIADRVPVVFQSAKWRATSTLAAGPSPAPLPPPRSAAPLA